MNILIEPLISKAGIDKFKKLQRILLGGILLDDKYRLEDSEKKCIFELERYYIEEPIEEGRFLFFNQYHCGTIKSILEVYPILEVKETKEGYEDLEIDLNEPKRLLSVATYGHSFDMFVADDTKIKIYDTGNFDTKGKGYFPKKYWAEVKGMIDYLTAH